MNWNMMLKMAVAALLYVLITAVLWRFCKGKKPFRTRLKVLIGLVFGACSVASNHIGIEYHDMLIMNVLDIGPLSAGLFFSPLSGIIAGTVGSTEFAYYFQHSQEPVAESLPGDERIRTETACIALSALAWKRRLRCLIQPS